MSIRNVIIATMALIVATGCSTPSLGRLPPYLGEVQGCPELVAEMELTNKFCDYAREHSDYSKGMAVVEAGLTAVGGGVAQGGELQELHQAWKTAVVRRHGLEKAHAEQSCANDKPEWSCPRPCGAGASFFRWPDADAESCVAFSRNEIRLYGFTQCTNNRGEPLECPE